MPAYWKLLLLARSGWKRLPPEQRRKLLMQAGAQARKHGPAVARAAGTAVRNARKAK
jgi:acyl-CoA reductase-like NAD-dependent aldehyde dehydrogenase